MTQSLPRLGETVHYVHPILGCRAAIVTWEHDIGDTQEASLVAFADNGLSFIERAYYVCPDVKKIAEAKGNYHRIEDCPQYRGKRNTR